MKKYRIEEEEQSFENDFPTDRPLEDEEISIMMNGPAMFVILDRDGRNFTKRWTFKLMFLNFLSLLENSSFERASWRGASDPC